jgi:hypothetical protein
MEMLNMIIWKKINAANRLWQDYLNQTHSLDEIQLVALNSDQSSQILESPQLETSTTLVSMGGQAVRMGEDSS